VKLDFTKRAERDARRIHARWGTHADHKETFARELLETLEHLISVSSPGTPCGTAKHPGLRRMLMPKSECHVYFEIDQRRDVVRVLTVWSGLRGRAPSL
jgi:plasmid stabilization system protein ParE